MSERRTLADLMSNSKLFSDYDDIWQRDNIGELRHALERREKQAFEYSRQNDRLREKALQLNKLITDLTEACALIVKTNNTEEEVSWCKENYPNKFQVVHSSDADYIVFEETEHALAFKLRWQ